MNLNVFVFNAINGIANESGMLDKIMIMFSKYGPLMFMAALAGFYLYGVYSRNKMLRNMVVDTFAITVLSLFLGFVIGTFYYEPRPFVTNKVNLLMPHAPDTSFPSDHSLGTMSIALGVNYYNNVSGTILILLSLMVGASRVYVGAHYPLDVLGSYLIVLAVNYLYGRSLRDKIGCIYFKAEEFLLRRISRVK
jgi:undecaprenyl-diphosphatase